MLSLQNSKEPSATNDVWSPQRRVVWVALLLVILFSASVRFRLLDVPLERDEGEYAYAGQLILQGIPPYQEVYNMKLPGIYAAYAVALALFGQTHRGIHLALLLINAATILSLFHLSRRLLGDLAAVMAAASFALLSISQSVQGVFANAEHFVILFAITGLIALLRAVDSNRLIPLVLSGLLLGAAVLMKQHGAAFVVMAGLYLVIQMWSHQPQRWRANASRCAIFALAIATPYLVTCLILWSAGVFDSFWFWTVTYASTYATRLPLKDGPAMLMFRVPSLLNSAVLIWPLAAVGITAIWWNRPARKHWMFILLLTVFSFLAVVPGFFFRKHYFVLTLPVVSLLAGLAISAIRGPASTTQRFRPWVAILMIVVCLGQSVLSQYKYLFTMTPTDVARATYDMNPFPESLRIGDFINSVTTEEDRIAVLGSEPQLFFYARRRSATGFVYMYALMENHDLSRNMQKQLIREIEGSDAEVLVFVDIHTSWLTRPDSHRQVFDWFERYRSSFALVAVAELQSEGTRYYYDAEIAELKDRPQYSVQVYRRVRP